MKRLNGYRIKLVVVGFVAAIIIIGNGIANAAAINQAPIADAGLPRYAALDPVVLDGRGSYDPDNSGPLTYAWRQISGPSVAITDAETATPTISGFVQTDEIQECEFELVVSDGEYDSFPDAVKVIVVPTLTESIMLLENESFDPQKPTIIFFEGYSGSKWAKATTGGGEWRNKASKVGNNFPAWEQRANIISFSPYVADDASSDRDTATYYRCADMIIVYLSAWSPDYDKYIQTMGHSLGGMPAIDVARFLNDTYKDRRYAINRVSLFDTTVYLNYSHRIRDGFIER
ncbi:MAG: PKD domain-containing protein, partial [Planctomycetota bacterium]